MKRKDCPICGSGKQSFVYPHKIEPISEIPTLYNSVVVCGSCGMVYAGAVVEQNTYDRYYREFSKYEQKYRETDSVEVYAQHQEIIDLTSELIPQKSAAIVDLGAGHGTTLSLIKKKGYSNLCAVELSEANCSYIREKYGITAINKSIHDLNAEVTEAYGFGEFDCIIMEGVLEHLVDLHSTVDDMCRLLKNGGIAVICVPAFGTNSSINAELMPFEAFSSEHINFFTAQSLSLLMCLHGFTEHKHQVGEGRSPALYSVFIKQDTSKVMEKYINYSLAGICSTENLIASYANSGKPIAIRGTGLLTRYLFANSKLGKCNIVAVADGNKNYQGRTIAGHVISSSDVFNELSPDVDILVMSYLYAEAMRIELQNAGLTNNIICLPIKE